MGLVDLRVKLFQDGAELASMIAAKKRGSVSGFTTNPTLMRKAGVTNYKEFAVKAIAAIPDLPISFEVFSDDFDTMEREAREIASWGGNTYVKIPISNTKGESSGPLIRKLSNEKFSLNITAILTLDQVREVATAVDPGARTIVSVFAGRIADTGVDPVKIMTLAAQILQATTKSRTAVGKPARGPQRHPSAGLRMSHHHRNPRHHCEGVVARQGSKAVLARHGKDVL